MDSQALRIYWRPGCSSCVKVKEFLSGLGVPFERCAWHSAQHARQIIAVLDGFGVAPDVPLTAQDYAGLPMPPGLWE